VLALLGCHELGATRDVVGLIIGAKHASAIATLVERTSRSTLLVALPEGRTAEAVSAALTAKITELPDRLRASRPSPAS